MKIIQSRTFERKTKRFKKQEKKVLDKEIRRIMKDPLLGKEKRGELQGVSVHKFKVNNVQYLLSYRISDDNLELIMIGSHENYYKDLKTYLKHRPQK